MKKVTEIVVVVVILFILVSCSQNQNKNVNKEEAANVCFVVCDSITQRAIDWAFVKIVTDTGCYGGRLWSTERTNVAGYTEFVLPQGLWRVHVNLYLYYPSGAIKFAVKDSLYRDTIWLVPVEE